MIRVLRARDGLRARGDPELAVDGLDVAVHGVERHVELAADLALRQPAAQQPQDRALALAQLGSRRAARGRAPRAAARRAGSAPGVGAAGQDRLRLVEDLRRAVAVADGGARRRERDQAVDEIERLRPQAAQEDAALELGQRLLRMAVRSQRDAVARCAPRRPPRRPAGRRSRATSTASRARRICSARSRARLRSATGRRSPRPRRSTGPTGGAISIVSCSQRSAASSSPLQ